jgi:miniconductance mechanosensitive channel
MLDRLEEINSFLPSVALLGALVLAAIVAHFVVRRALIAFMHMLAGRGSMAWDDALVRFKVFHRITHVIPAIVVYRGIALVGAADDKLVVANVVAAVQNLTMAYVALMVTLAIAAALSAGNEIYEQQPIARDRPLKGVVQIVQIIVYVIGTVIVVSHLIGKSPLVLLSGFGARSAVMLLVFKDSILGFVAGLQLTANDMVRVGDWIEMPAYGADGDVIEVALHTVKIQNWDKTITTVPTYKLIAESFRNWRGMTDAGGRRIKRSLNIDQQSIRFLTDEEIERLGRFSLLRKHLETKRQELETAASSLGDAGREAVNRRRLTNIGVFRAYITSYLHSHPGLHPGMTTMVRQLQPGPEGLPIEIYCFTRTTAWLEYEDVQSDMFDHILAILPEFGLRLFQTPTGADLERLGSTRSQEA